MRTCMGHVRFEAGIQPPFRRKALEKRVEISPCFDHLAQEGGKNACHIGFSAFWIASLFKVFLIQGIFMFVTSLVIQMGQISQMPKHFTWLDVTGMIVWGIGYVFETVGDWQLARFKGNPENKGKEHPTVVLIIIILLLIPILFLLGNKSYT